MISREAQEDRMQADPWEDLIREYLEDRDVVTSEQLLVDAVAVPKDRLSNSQHKRVCGIMKSLGWEPARVTVVGRQIRGFRRAGSSKSAAGTPMADITGEYFGGRG